MPARRTRSLSEPLAALRRIPIRENGEPLVDLLTHHPGLRWAPASPRFVYPRTALVRQRVAEMLAEAQWQLPSGVHLQIVGGWRSREVQRRMYETTYREFKEQHPDWTEAHLRRRTNQFSAPPDHPSPPPHLTGGAVDLRLADEANEPLDMWSPYEIRDRRAARFDAPGLSAAARANRALLADVLAPSGLTNYIAEWWHWSYGDQGWAYRIDAEHAIYGPVDAPAGVEEG